MLILDLGKFFLLLIFQKNESSSDIIITDNYEIFSNVTRQNELGFKKNRKEREKMGEKKGKKKQLSMNNQAESF